MKHLLDQVPKLWPSVLELVVLGEHIAGHPGAEVNRASMGGGRGVPRERENRQVDIRLNGLTRGC
ncbi:hypothetical protein CK218_28255 [Mesorhizobium sp. WSM3879]|nr:hypothetical protein CK214_27825 [Mesorhizobium sp. WSM3882]PBB31160.1 hypothetical protein CK221_27830 [Mesorhizobium sp. WSM3868]PBB77824.1 hypothetical protein CK218_28255 [Mesorhizobium sp. WSM3879]PBB89659.1 hypothetical protein CK215_26220 [Mesorhizobium sp. WSM3864]